MDREKNIPEMKEFEIGKYVVGVATGIGPRILKLARRETPGENLFGILPGFGMQTADGFWRIYGGHRLWTAPEASPRSYSPDSSPVRIEAEKGAISIYGNTEIQNSVEKEIVIRDRCGNGLDVLHVVRNTGRWTIELACWALTVMRPGGFAILPVRRAMEGLLPDRKVILWPYTDLSDKRIVWEKDYIFLIQDGKAAGPCKIGVSANPSWTAYWSEGILFVKGFEASEGPYPDHGSSVEAYTNSEMLELETLGPLTRLEPGEKAVHRETWSILKAPGLSPSGEATRFLVNMPL